MVILENSALEAADVVAAGGILGAGDAPQIRVQEIDAPTASDVEPEQVDAPTRAIPIFAQEAQYTDVREEEQDDGEETQPTPTRVIRQQNPAPYRWVRVTVRGCRSFGRSLLAPEMRLQLCVANPPRVPG